MHAPPSDPVDAVRMIDALDQAGEALGVVADGPTVWGRTGRAAGRRVRYERGAAWLAVRSAPVARARGGSWDGNAAAEKAFGDLAGVRPPLLNLYDWADGGTAYRAELAACLDEPMCSSTPEASLGPDPGDRWWATLRRTLETVGRADTDRVAVDQTRIDATVPRLLGVPAPRIERTVPSHADLHWAHVTAHGPHVIGWDRWGHAPVGYDAAKLYAWSLASPGTAARVRSEFPVLETELGRIAEVVAVAELIATVDPAGHPALFAALRTRARDLLPPASRRRGSAGR
ncbi:MAG TPA: hypothetical protein VLH10_04800 [Yinghuangia sp.]|nr:hypothetical protein [Yinghuangia sp.]